jgi:glycosyltransferase involved in cell wall biosynthesis
MYLSVIIPCYNEETNIRNGVLHVVCDYLEKQPYDKEVLIIDDGSDDKSTTLIEKFISEKNPKNFHLIKNSHGGKAATVISGLQAGNGDIVMFTDMDQATPIEEIEKILPHFTQGFDIVIGSRAGRRAGAPFSRQILSQGFMFIKMVILGIGSIQDTQCGFKAFKRETITPLISKLRINGTRKSVKGGMVSASFDLEILFIARKLGYKIKEVPVRWHYVGTKRVNALKEAYRGIRDVALLKLNDLRGLYN